MMELYAKKPLAIIIKAFIWVGGDELPGMIYTIIVMASLWNALYRLHWII